MFRLRIRILFMLHEIALEHIVNLTYNKIIRFKHGNLNDSFYSHTPEGHTMKASTATETKNNFGHCLDLVMQGQEIIVTRKIRDFTQSRVAAVTPSGLLAEFQK